MQTNHDKAVESSWDERRFMLLECKPQKYTKAHWQALWQTMQDPQAQQIFYQHLRHIDISNITIGAAPLTSTKKEAIADQAPTAIRWLVDNIQSGGKDLCRPISTWTEMERMNNDDVMFDFHLKHRDYDTTAFHNLIGEDLHLALLCEDLARGSKCMTRVPMAHVFTTIQNHFTGQRYMASNHQQYKKTLKQLGLQTDRMVRVYGGITNPTRCVIFPRVYLFRV